MAKSTKVKTFAIAAQVTRAAVILVQAKSGAEAVDKFDAWDWFEEETGALMSATATAVPKERT